MVNTDNRMPPQDLNSERALLGAIMLKPTAIYDIADIVVPESFYATKHKIIFEAMMSLFSKNEPIDLVTLSSKLKETKQLDNIGGRPFLSELVSASPSISNSMHYAQIIKGKHVLRQLIDAANMIGEMGYKEDKDIDCLLDEAQSTVYQIANTSTLQKFTSMKEELAEAWHRLETLQDSKDKLRGIHTGFAQLDNLLAGFQKSDLIILAARPSMGKTTLALDIARQSSIHNGTAVGLFSLEMSSQQLVDRMLASEAKVNAWKLRTGKLSSDDEYDRLRDAMDRLSAAPIYIDDKVDRTVLQMRSIARKLKAEKKLDLVVVDYLQLITPSNIHANTSLVMQITEISRALKGMARELDIPVIALSQLSRAVEQRRDRPRLSDLRDSGSIEQDADVVMFIHRDDKMNPDSERPNIADILIEKHRNGPVGRVELYFDDEKTTFLPVEKHNFGDFAEESNEDVNNEEF